MKTFLITLVSISLVAFLFIDWHISIQIFDGSEVNQLAFDNAILIAKLFILVFAVIYSTIHLVAWLAKKVKISVKA